jgi:hypothetical protein
VKPLRLAFLSVAIGTPALAQPIQFSATLQGDLGYGSNPFVRPGVSQSAGLGSVTFSPKLVYEDPKSTTTLSGQYSRDQYFSRFGHTDMLDVGLERKDQLTAYLASTLDARFSSTNKATIADPTLIDNEPLNLGRRTYRTNGQYQLQWQATARDQFSYGAQIEHLAYGRDNSGLTTRLASNYTQYSVNGGYSRAVDARTMVGAQVSVSAVRSQLYPDSRTIQPSITAKRQLNAVWSFDGHIGVVLQHVSGPFASSTTSLGYGANLCGAYPRTNICITVNRDTSASGYGALRTTSGVSLTWGRKLTEHSNLSFSANFYKSNSDQSLTGAAPTANSVLPLRNSRALLLKGQYDRDLTQRISAGFGGSYQWRDTAQNGSGRAISGTIHVTAKLGRL